MIDVIILSYAYNDELYFYTDRCIKSILDSESNSSDLFNIIVLESQKDVSWDHLPNTKTYDPPKPYGYHKFMNYGRKLGLPSMFVFVIMIYILLRDGLRKY